MKSSKLSICLFLVVAMLFVLLAGCGAKTDDTSSEQAGEPWGGTDIAVNTTFTLSTGLDLNGFFEGVRALDYVETFNYQAMPIPSEAHHISDDAIQNEINNLLANFPVQVLDRAVIDGDTVNIDYVGSIDGVEFDGGSTGGMGTNVTIGVTSYIDDFLEQLIGHMPGETIDVEVTFPDSYHEETLQGKDAVFVTTINHIVGKAELTDDFVAANLSAYYGWTTVGEMEEEMRSGFQQQAIQQYISQYLSTQVPVRSVPDQLISYQQQAMISSYSESAGYYGLELEEFLAGIVGVASVDELIEHNNDNILEMATYSLVVQAVAESLSLSVSDEDLVNFFIKNVGTDDYSQFEEQYGLPYLKQFALHQMVLDYIAQNAVLL